MNHPVIWPTGKDEGLHSRLDGLLANSPSHRLENIGKVTVPLRAKVFGKEEEIPAGFERGGEHDKLVESAMASGRLATWRDVGDHGDMHPVALGVNSGDMDSGGIWLKRSKEIQRVLYNAVVYSQAGRRPTATAQACAKLAVPK